MRLKFAIVLILWHSRVFCQFSDGFDDGNLTNNPVWKGDVAEFTVDSDQKLRLNASGEGTSWLFVNTSYPDSFELGIKVKLEFSPSASNACKIYFLIDNEDLTKAKGYFFLLGENGSADRLKVFKTDNGTETLLTQGTESALAKDPSLCNIRVILRNSSQFTISADYDANGSFDDHFSFEDASYPTNASAFGMFCTYTSTRADKFVFDDIYLKPFELDKTGPEVTTLSVLNERELILFFNEALDEVSASRLENYSINKGIGVPGMVIFDKNLPNQVTLSFTKDFSSTTENIISINNVKDVNGNPMTAGIASFFFAASPASGDLVLSEILFNPIGTGQDFVEVFNASEKNLDLKGLIIKNHDSGFTEVVESSYILQPQSFVAISEDTASLKEIYSPPSEASFIQNDLPSFNNDEGIPCLLGKNNLLLDSFRYNEDLHLSFIDDVEGVSLEKIQLLPLANSSQNWVSAAASVKFATPGYKNSNSLSSTNTENEFYFENKVFSPDGDAKDDILFLIYNLPESGYIANFTVYSSEGYLVKNLTKNELLGTNGLLRWDGTNDDGVIVKPGIYIIIGKLFNPSGDTRMVKKDCVLATFID